MRWKKNQKSKKAIECTIKKLWKSIASVVRKKTGNKNYNVRKTKLNSFYQTVLFLAIKIRVSLKVKNFIK